MLTNLFSLSTVFLQIIRLLQALKTPTLVEIFRDDFNVDGPLNTSVWTATHRDSLTYKELGYYRNDTINVENGSMVLRVLQKPFGTTNYTAARVETAGNFSFLYGEVEWRAQIVGDEGFWSGLWISRRMKSNRIIADYYPPAACFVDYVGYSTMRAFHGDVTDPNKTIEVAMGIHSNNVLAGLTDIFYTYKMVWTRSHLEFYVDDHLVYHVDEPAKIPHQHLQLVMNVAAAGPFALQDPKPGVKMAKEVLTRIDYVVVRQNWTALTNGSLGARGVRRDETVPAYVGLTIGLLAGALVVVILGGALFFYKCRQHDRVVPRYSRRQSLLLDGSTYREY